MVETGKLVVGLHLPQNSPDASELLKSARDDGYDFVTTSLPSTQTNTVRPDVAALTARWWRTSVVGMVPEEGFAPSFFERLQKKIEWAMHMGIPAVILPSCPSDGIAEYARAVLSLGLETQACNLQIWIRTRLNATSLGNYETLHRLCGGLSNIGMILEIEPVATMNSVASTVGTHMILIHKAIGMQLKALTLPTKIFLTNKKGYPTLAKSHQTIFSEIMRRIGRTIRVLVEGPSVHDQLSSAGETKCMAYLQYVRHVRTRAEIVAALDTEEATLETPYLDGLQRPLEPLKDHLEFSMYETFEKDPVKYSKYQEAVYLALKSMNLASSTSETPKTITIAVAGAGRGPLVMRSIQAFRQLQIESQSVKLKVYALEKNPSAVVYLQSMAQTNPLWHGVVTVIDTDVRKLTRDQHLNGDQIDIVVSELLGSFGDNELSPECLDPLLASECCKNDTISIPMQYSTYVAPISSCRLYTEATQQAQVPHEGAQPLGIQRSMETSYVVRTHAASQTHAEQLCWTFDHPATTQNKERTATLEFMPDPTYGTAYGCGYGPVDPTLSGIVTEAKPLSTGGITLHGLVGSFTAVLFENETSKCTISIAPHEFSEGMFSWFPIYFPFHEPLRLPASSNVKVKMWRKTKANRVWFEWCAVVHRDGEIIATTPIHNPNGRSSHVSM